MEQKIKCGVNYCKHNDCDCCSLNEIKVCNCNCKNAKCKEKTMCDNFEPKD